LTVRALATAALATLAAIITIAAGAPAQARPIRLEQPVWPPAAPPAGPVRLSNETTFTRWANAVERAKAYARPSANAHGVGRLRFLTEDGYPEVYVALTARRSRNGTRWVRLRLPQRPNDVTGWVRDRSLGPMHLLHTRLVVNRAKLRVTLYDRGKRRFTARVGIGAASTPTPAGSFWVREKFHVAGHTLYGPRAIGTSAYSNVLTDWPGGGVVGLHGTSEPRLIPGRPSHGCVRLKNPDVERLYALVPVGTPLLIK
jgi:lipoprotein-anchoring transpeptidase ErfK/SrfK